VVRNQAIKEGLIDKILEPLSIQTKGFWELSSAFKVRKILMNLLYLNPISKDIIFSL
jgi:hypothetical protein